MIAITAHVDGDTLADAIVDDMEECARFLCQLGENLNRDTEDFVSWVEDLAGADPAQKLALQALAGLILKGCE